MGVHRVRATRKYRTIDSFISFYVNRKRRGPATFLVHSRGFTAACNGGRLSFSSFPPLWEEEIWQLQLYRCSHWRKSCISSFPPVRGRKSGNGSFTAVPIGGKAAISSLPPLWEEENLKCRIRCGCIWRKSFNPILYPFFPSFACWSVMGRGLVPQNGGWPCVTDNWVEKISIHNKS